MDLSVKSLADVDPDLVTAAQAKLTQLLQDTYPQVEIQRGVVHDLLLYLNGVVDGVRQTETNRYLNSRSILQIQTDPALADPALVDEVLSNFGAERFEGGRSSGQMTIVVSADVTVVLPLALGFTANGQRFVLDQAYSAKSTTATLTDPSDRQLTPLGNGTFSFTVPLTAVNVGTAGNIKRTTKLDPDRPFTNFVTAYASTDFAGGDDAETNKELIDKLEDGLAAKTISDTPNLIASIKAQPQFSQTLTYSVMGLGNPEQMRDQHWIFPVSGGGRLDVYSRTSYTPQQVEFLRTSTLVEITPAGAVWQFVIPRDLAPGFYEVVQVRRTTDDAAIAGFSITSDVRGFDLSGDGFIPDVQTEVEAAYSRWQTAVIRFVDAETPTTGLTVGTKTDFFVAVVTMPLLAELQAFLTAPQFRNRTTDVLVKGAVPCFLTINFEIEKAAGDPSPDVAPIKQAVADMVNKLGFIGKLHTSKVADVVHNYLSGRQAVGDIDIRGRIRRPDGEPIYIHDVDSVLQVPNDPSNMTTPDTVGFILFAEDVGVAVVVKNFGTGV